MPGRSYSNRFLICWSEFMLACWRNGIQLQISQNYDPVVYYARNKCLGGHVLRGRNQKPFDGKMTYDYMVWIDSDILFNYDQVMKLISLNKDIAAGLYVMEDGQNFAAVRNWDEEYFAKNGTFQFIHRDELKDQKDPVEVCYSGMGLFVVKNGVFESLEYPWFRPIFHDLSKDGRDIYDFASEDAALCLRLREKGYKIVIDPTVVVGHEKSLVL